MSLAAVGATISAAAKVGGAAQALTNQGPASGIVNVIGVGATPLGGSLPAPNVLSKYASYNYVIGLSAMTLADYNFPDQSYKKGKIMPLICKTAGADPNNRVNTAYGKYDFFIDNIVLDAVIGLTDVRTTNVTTVKFEVYEPYSIGIFVMALQQAAASCGLLNWRDGNYLLTVEFRGNTESGQMLKVPFSTRHIPIKITTIQMRASETGSKYIIEAYASQGQALTTQYANLKTDTIIQGKTVQEVLQTGKQSLQSVVNDRLKEFVKSGQVKVADRVVIVFPTDISTSKGTGTATSDTGATVSTTVAASSTNIFENVGVNESDLVQNTELNHLGASNMGYSYERKGGATAAKESETYDEKTGIWKRGSMVVNSKEGTLKFTQNMDIPSVINQVLLTSEYSKVALKSGEVSTTGMRKWWRIDTQVYYLPSKDNIPKTGTYPRVIVYRVVPYDAHVGKSMAPNEPPPGIDAIKQQLVKNYDYIYTGKNSEILKFDIDYSVNFANVLAADDGKNNSAVSLASKNSDSNANKTNPQNTTQVVNGSTPDGVIGSSVSQTKQDGLDTGTEKGGSVTDTEANRAGRFFHMGITNPNDMINLSMEIMGDPYWIVNSGMGNYTSKPVTGVKDLNLDGSVNWQSGEVDIGIYFRSPLDINQGTGLYDFKSANTFNLVKAGKAAPTIAFTGLYKITQVTNVFKGGRFTQTLLGYRRPLQELQKTADPTKTLSSDSVASDVKPVDNKS